MTSTSGVVCTIAIFLPVIVILYYRLYIHKSLAALAVNGILTGSYSLMSEGLLPVSKELTTAVGIINNYLDAPLMLFGLLFFCPNRHRQRPVYILISLLLVYSLFIGINSRFSRSSIVYVLGPGLAMILGYATYLFSRQVRFTVARGKNAGRMLMLASILFAYGSYAFMYLFFYVLQTENIKDIFLLYTITAIISSILMTTGLHLTRKRVREFREVKNTRRELEVFFNQAR
jgi:hypothetical protein